MPPEYRFAAARGRATSLSSTAHALWAVLCALADDENTVDILRDDLRAHLGRRNAPGLAGRSAYDAAMCELLADDASLPLLTRELRVDDERRFVHTVTVASRPIPSGVADALRTLVLSCRVGAAQLHIALALALHCDERGVVRCLGDSPSKAGLQTLSGLDRRPAFAALTPLAAAGFVVACTPREGASLIDPERYAIVLARSGDGVGTFGPFPALPAPASPVVTAPVVDESVYMVAAMRECHSTRETVEELICAAVGAGAVITLADGEDIYGAAAEVERRAHGRHPQWQSILKDNWLRGAAKTLMQPNPAACWHRYLIKCVRNFETGATEPHALYPSPLPSANIAAEFERVVGVISGAAADLAADAADEWA